MVLLLPSWDSHSYHHHLVVCLFALTNAFGLLVAVVCEAGVTGTRVAARFGAAGTVSTDGLVDGTNVCNGNKSMVSIGPSLPRAASFQEVVWSLLPSPSHCSPAPVKVDLPDRKPKPGLQVQ